jgi:flavin reductase (DIM6/NTAB) family NADH-FMN oxidoreductase RutF
MRSVDPPLIVLTTAVEHKPAGCLVGFHAQSSIGPQRYCVWLSKANHTYRAALRATHFEIHFLTDSDVALAERFGTLCGEETDKFDGIHVSANEHGVPVLEQCANRLSVEGIGMVDDGGDHVCLTTEIVSAEHGRRFSPLRVSSAVDLEPGHRPDERAIRL